MTGLATEYGLFFVRYELKLYTNADESAIIRNIYIFNLTFR